MPILPAMLPDTQAFDVGLTVAEVGDDPAALEASLSEKALVKTWFEKIERAREHDRSAYGQLAKDRSYARGDSSFEVKVNVIGSYIDTWGALLYARNPDVDALPSDTVGNEGLEDARLVGRTAQIIISKQWRKAKLKPQAKVWVRAALTSKVGWIKATWQDHAKKDPTATAAIQDQQMNLARLEQLKKELIANDQPGDAHDRQIEEIKLTIAGLQSRTEAKRVRGWAIDPVDMADMTVSDECPSIERYLESPWISHRSYPRLSDVKAQYPDVPEEAWKKAKNFARKRPIASVGDKSGNLVDNWSADDATSYAANEITQELKEIGTGGFVCLEEVWDRDTGMVITLCHGMDRYVCQPWAPNPGTSRFYPFFGLTFTGVDGQRWAQSLNERSQSLQDAYDRAYATFEKVRRRLKPRTLFNAGAVDADGVKKVVDADDIEFVPVQPTGGLKVDMRSVFTTLQLPQIDPMLYDTRIIMEKFELVWGLQEAMSGTIDVAKTATESEIQQGGTQARTTNKRDTLEDQLSELAQYMFEVDVQVLSEEEAIKMAGIEALWPVGITPEDFDQLAVIEVRAGSSGKPNSRAMRETWAAMMQPIMGLSQQIAQLRNANPLEFANCLEELLTETLARSGENIDETRFVPPEGEPPLIAIDPMTGAAVPAWPAMTPQPAAGAPMPAAPAGPPAPAASADDGAATA